MNARPWLGPLALAPSSLRSTLEAAPSYRALLARGWDPRQTLVFAPRRRDGYELDICVVARTFAWDETSPVVWLLSSIGLCHASQPQLPERPAFRRFELVLACSGGRDDPFPDRLGVALTLEGYGAWDWNQVAPPPLMDWLVIAAEEIGSLMNAGSHFAITDTVTLGPGKSPWTRSLLDHSLLLPAPPQLLVSGFAPFEPTRAETDTVRPAEWHLNPGVADLEYGFYWLVPVSESEHAQADQRGSWQVFGGLTERSRAQSGDPFALVFDLLRS